MKSRGNNGAPSQPEEWQKEPGQLHQPKQQTNKEISSFTKKLKKSWWHQHFLEHIEYEQIKIWK